MDNLSGNDIKGYELRERIGTGGFGAVYRAYQTTVGREVAIKFILPGFANQPDFIRRFETEAQLIARLEHPHITPLYDYWRDPDGAYLVMRWLRGGSLRETLQNGIYDVRSTALLLDQICSALSLAHRSGVIHRDLKPGNILLDEDSNAYLADFGIAKDLKMQGSHTQPDAIVGSLDYISPEQARSEPVTPRTDIYSLGVVLYELLTGHHPFLNISAVERLYKHINDPLPAITGLDASVEDSVNQIIQKATAKNPENRYADALAFAADFREAAGLNRTPTGQTVEALLTPREHEILRLIIEGLANKEIAQRLTITVGTVKWYVNQIFSKLHARSRVQAIIRARELNLIGGTTAQAAEVVSSISNLAEMENPYKGLRAFQSADERDFFGRDELTQKLVNRMRETSSISSSTKARKESDGGHHARFLAVVGPSGSGKSSLVKAGLIPALWRGELPGSEKWFVVEMLPETHPLDKLEIALIKFAADHSGSLNEQLRRDARGLLRASDLILPNDDSELVLVIDQFEEVFTLVEDESERQHFLNLLVTAINDAHSRVRVVITLRADFYDRPLNYPDFGELVRSCMETVMPLSAKGLERAIAGPAERVGIRFEPGLVAAMVSEMNYQAGALPLLQYALTELFERREGRLLTHQAYQEIGGAVGALAKRSEEVYLDLTQAGQEVARQMFLRLVTLGEGVEDTRRRVERSELLVISPDTELMDEIIDVYAGQRLFSLDNDPASRAPTVELAHEAVLREWERLRGWLNDNRADIRLQRQLASLAAEWERAKEDPSYLLRGGRLEIFEKWQSQNQLALTPAEQNYLQTSLTQRKKEQAVEQERQQRVTALERRSMRFLQVLVGVLVLATLGALGLSGIALGSANEAQSNFKRAEENSQYARSIALASAAKSALLLNNPDQSLTLAIHANSVTNNPPAFARSMLYDAAFVPATRWEYADQNSFIRTAISPDGKQMLALTEDKSSVVILDMLTGKKLGQWIPAFLAGNLICSMIFAPGGETGYLDMITPDSTGAIIEFEASSGQEIQRFTLPEGISCGLALSTGSQTLLISTYIDRENGSLPGPVYRLDTTTGKIIQQTNLEVIGLTPVNDFSISFSDDGQKIAAAFNTGLIALWDANTGKLIRSFGDEEFGRPQSFFVSSGLMVVKDLYNTLDTTVTLWNEDSGEQLHRQSWNSNSDISALSPDGRTLAVGFVAARIALFDVEHWQSITDLYGHTFRVINLQFTPDNHFLLSGSFDNSLRLWNLKNGNERLHIEGLLEVASDFKISPNGHYAAAQEYSPSEPARLGLWNLETGELIRTLADNTNSFRGITFSPDGNTIASTSMIDGGTCQNSKSILTLTDLNTGAAIWQNNLEQTSLFAGLTFTGDGSQILSISDCENFVTVWDAKTGKKIGKWEGHKSFIWGISASPDGKWVATASDDTTAILWDATTGTTVHTIQYSDAVGTVAFSADSRLLLLATLDGNLHVWDIASAQEIKQLVGHTSSIWYMQFSPDGHYIVSSSGDSNIFVWDWQLGEIVRQFRLPLFSPTGGIVAFSPDGQSIYTETINANDSKPVILKLDLMLEPGELLNWVEQNRYVRDLTCAERVLYRVEPLCESELKQ